jgi:hypothetical protein
MISVVVVYTTVELVIVVRMVFVEYTFVTCVKVLV